MNRHVKSSSICLLQLLLFAAGSSVIGGSQNGPSRVPVTANMVAAALSQQGMDVSADQLDMPAHLVALGVPALQVTQAELIGSQRLRIHLTSAQIGQCPPFWVLVRLPATSSGLLSLSTLKQNLPSQSPSSAVQSEHLLAGQRVTLLLEDMHMRIVLPVIAIDSGTRGAEVRVTSLDRKQSYVAIVESAAIVRGSLP